MLKNLRKNEKGFTIIEVLIVLAIAGLLMLVVFLAVPALQRNQRNSSRKNDVSRIGSAVSEFYGNNNGAAPTSATLSQITSSAGTLSQYDATNISVAAGAATNAAVSTLTSVVIVTGAKCTTAGAASSTGATSRQAVIQYAVETSGNPTSICLDL